jgi:hypothetical protein
MKTKLFLVVFLVTLLAAPLWAKGPAVPAASSELDTIETANILYLYEEEKLAHDIYVEMYIKYGAYIFENIKESEQRHMDAVERLIVKYGLVDDVLYKDPGVFINETIQGEYNRLWDKGIQSLKSALEVGVEIEEMDIADIERMKQQTDEADIDRVLSNLLDGSYKHLNAFEAELGL